jgi:hypothetical protein
VKLETQQERNWCWASVAQGVAAYFGGPLQQCAVAAQTLGSNCCSNRGPCDVPWALDPALAAVGHYRTWAARALSLADVAAEIDAGNPLPIRIQWKDEKAGGHFLLLGGYDAGTDMVVVHDPGSAPGPQWIPIDELETAYQAGAGYWSHTYWVA